MSLRRSRRPRLILRLAAPALCGCLAVAPGRAEGANAAGFGLTSCADAAQLFDQPAYRSAFFTWMLGFARRADVFDYIERFYNPARRHSTLGYVCPVEFENRAQLA